MLPNPTEDELARIDAVESEMKAEPVRSSAYLSQGSYGSGHLRSLFLYPPMCKIVLSITMCSFKWSLEKGCTRTCAS